MSSSDFKTLLVKDPLISNITSEITFGVVKGGQTVNKNYVVATSKGATHNFVYQVPNQETLISPETYWHSAVELTYSFTQAVGQNNIEIDVGKDVVPRAFPCTSVCSSQKATINNTNFQLDSQNLIDLIQRFHDPKRLSKYNGGCPTQGDYYKSYANKTGNNTPFSDYSTAQDVMELPRGAYPIKFSNAAGSFTPTICTISANQSKLTISANNGQGAAPRVVKFTLLLEDYEPLMFSPFVFAHPENASALYSITNMNLVFTIGSVENMFSFAPQADLTFSSASANWTTSELVFHQITGHPSDMAVMPVRNIHNYLSYPYWIQYENAAGANHTFTTNAIQLNIVPDFLVLAVSKAGKGPFDSSTFEKIKSIKVNFNNNTSLLGTYKPLDLWHMSAANDIHQDYLQFTGSALVDGAPAVLAGSVVCMRFGIDIPLTEDWLASGCMINTNLQAFIECEGLTPGEKYEIKMLTVNGGIVSFEKGTAFAMQGILSREAILAASSQEARSLNDVKRIVGGSWIDRVLSVVKKVAPVAKAVAQQIDHPVAKMASDALGMAGYGRSGGLRRRV